MNSDETNTGDRNGERQGLAEPREEAAAISAMCKGGRLPEHHNTKHIHGSPWRTPLPPHNRTHAQITLKDRDRLQAMA